MEALGGAGVARLTLFNCSLGDTEVGALVSLLEARGAEVGLEELDVGGNQISLPGMLHLFELLQKGGAPKLKVPER